MKTSAQGLRFEWLGLIALFLLAGIFGHDPWRGDETYGFGVIYHFYNTNTWLVPTNAGMPFMEKPPLYYWTAVLFCKLLDGVLPLHEAARLASVFYMVISTLLLWRISQLLFVSYPQRSTLGWVSIGLFLGSIGLLRYAHEMSTDVALLTGAMMSIYGMALLACQPQRWKLGGFCTGFGIGMALLCKGFFAPAVLGASAMLLWVLSPQLHTRRSFYAAGMALLATLPFLLWPLMLYLRAPELFHEWFWLNNVGRFAGFSVLGAANRPYYFLGVTPWFVFPSLLLACIAAVMGLRTNWRAPSYLLPMIVMLLGMVLLFISASGRVHYLLPIMPAFVLLGAQGLLRLPAGFLKYWNIAIRILFSGLILFLWLLWCGLSYPSVRTLAEMVENFTQGFPLAGRALPLDFMPGDQTVAVMAATLFTLFWLASLRLDPKTPRNSAQIWLTGMAALWGIIFTLLLPWIDETKSYRTVLGQMMRHVPAGECVANFEYNESISPMFGYMTGMSPVRSGVDAAGCRFLFVATQKTAAEEIAPQWKLLWRGHRTLDEKSEELRLYERK